MPPPEVELRIVGEQGDGPVHVAIYRIDVLVETFDVDYHGVVVELGRPVGEVELVVSERPIELARGDQVLPIEFDDLLVRRIAEQQGRGELVHLEEIFAVETQVGGQLPEVGDLVLQGEAIQHKESFDHAQVGAVFVPAVVILGQRSQRRHAGRVDGYGSAKLRERQRIGPHHAVKLAQHEAVFHFVGHGFGQDFGLLQRPVDLSRRDQ